MELFPSTLIIGKNPRLLEEKIISLLEPLGHNLSNNPDLYFIDEVSGWGIGIVRQLLNFLSHKPYNHHSKLIIIRQAQNLENEAQNALLKILEDPGPDRFLILTTPNPQLILGTIISRCHLIYLSENSTSDNLPHLEIPPDPKSALTLADTLNGDKNTIKDLLLGELSQLQKNIPLHSERIKRLLTSIDFINHNVDPKLALDYYLLSEF